MCDFRQQPDLQTEALSTQTCDPADHFLAAIVSGPRNLSAVCTRIANITEIQMRQLQNHSWNTVGWWLWKFGMLSDSGSGCDCGWNVVRWLRWTCLCVVMSNGYCGHICVHYCQIVILEVFLCTAVRWWVWKCLFAVMSDGGSVSGRAQ